MLLKISSSFPDTLTLPFVLYFSCIYNPPLYSVCGYFCLFIAIRVHFSLVALGGVLVLIWTFNVLWLIRGLIPRLGSVNIFA
ncbi:hypothetical protein BJY01DRAFT_96910 [Aspergillus pseudoustus]|uniref:Uncharacterized protein n=1 Tax=Aspergillus pseudoustus TaxID=1810923 RepID=A0ABR4IZD4_9EURO